MAPTTPGPTAAPSARSAPGVVLVVLVVAMAIGPVFNFGVSSLGPEIIADYGITEGRYGLVLTSLFVAAGLGAALLGALADRMPLRAQFALIHVGVALAFVIAAIGDDYVWLLVAAIIAGVAQAQSNPVTNRVIQAEAPLARRSAWMGWKQSGVQMGLLVAGLSFPLVGKAVGWAGAAWFGAALCAPALALSWWTVDRHLRGGAAAPAASAASAVFGAPGASAAPAASGSAPSRRAGLTIAMLLFPLASFLNAAGTQGVNGFAAVFAVRGLDVPLTVAGWILALIGVLGIAGRIGWGRIAGRRDRPAQLLLIMSAGGVVTMLLLVGAEQWAAAPLLWLAVPFHAVLPLAANVVINSGIVANAPPGRVGLASGLVATGMYLGFALGPLVVGGLVDATGGYTAAWLVLAGTYVACAAVALVLMRALPERDAPAAADGGAPHRP